MPLDLTRRQLLKAHAAALAASAAGLPHQALSQPVPGGVEALMNLFDALPADYRLLLSGHFAEYIHDLHGLTPGHRYAELQALGHINERALASDASGDDFSMSIRQGVPGVPADEVSP